MNPLIKLIQNNKSDDEILNFINSAECKKKYLNETDQTNNTPLILCANRNYLKSACKLLELGVNQNHTNLFGYSALSPAADDGSLDMVKALIEAQCEINDIYELHNKPINRALNKGRIETAIHLIRHLKNLNDLHDTLIEIQHVEKNPPSGISYRNLSTDDFKIIHETMDKKRFHLDLETSLSAKKEAITKNINKI